MNRLPSFRGVDSKTSSVRRNKNTEQEKNEFFDAFHSHGEIYFAGLEEPVKYVRTAKRTSQAQWHKLLAERWNLKPPTLIISILGSQAELSKRFKNTFKKGLWKAAEGAGCWIITDGFDHGLTKVAGEAVRDYTEAYGGNHMVMVGIAHLERVAFQELFDVANQRLKSRDANANVLYPDISTDEETDPSNTATTSLEPDAWIASDKSLGGGPALPVPPPGPTQPQSAHVHRLNPNHQYMVLVDPTTGRKNETSQSRLLEARIVFERTIVTWTKPSTRATSENASSKIVNSANPPDSTEVKGEKRVSKLDLDQTLNIKPTNVHRLSMALPNLTPTSVQQTLKRHSKILSAADGSTPGPGITESAKSLSSLTQRKELLGSDGHTLLNLDTENTDTASQATVRVPICGIVAGGNNFTIDQIYASVSLNRCPMVIVRGTGGIADIISNVLDFMNFKNSLEESVLTDQEIDFKIASIIQETNEDPKKVKVGGTRKKMGQTNAAALKSLTGKETTDAGQTGSEQPPRPTINVKDWERQIAILKELTEQYGHLLSVFECDDTDLDGYMISALLSSAGTDRRTNELNLDQLEITIRLNRADIARTKIFLEGKRWKKGDLDEFMFTVILNEQTDFVSLLIENGFNLEEFLTVHTLERLYTECLKKTDYKTSLLQQLWRSARIYKMDWVMLRDIGKLIKNLLGDFYQPLYLSKRFHKSVVQRGYQDSSDEDEKPDFLDIGSEVKRVSPEIQFKSPDITSASTLPDEEVRGQDSNINLNTGKDLTSLKTISKPSSGESEDKSSHSSDMSSDKSLMRSSRSRKHRHRSSRTEHRSMPPTYRITNGPQPFQPNGRRCIVKPISASRTNLSNNGFVNLAFTNGTGPHPPIGQRRVIGLNHAKLDKSEIPRALEESFSDYKTAKSQKKSVASETTNGSIKSIESLEIEVPQLKKPLAVPIPIVLEHSGRSSTSRNRGHATFTYLSSYPKATRSRSLGSRKSNAENSLFSPKNRSNDRVRRVTHSILHPLSDPEKARLRLREIERQARERKREKERKRRHRIAQEKFTIMERLTGKAKAERLEELKPAKLANFAHTATVKFDRPCRELMVMCVLLGRIEMAELFWNQEKEPIAAALVSSILLGELGKKSDDVANKEEYDEAARSFEVKAEQVLDECHQEDRYRTILLLYRKLEFYGGSSLIRLAARGKCIRFMAHPGCQDLLSGIWMGNLSTKSTWIQIFSGVLLGMTIPIMVPQIMRYTAQLSQLDPLADQVRPDDSSDLNDSIGETPRSGARPSIWYDKGQSIPSRIKLQLTRVKEFYQAPVIRFVYNTVFYLLFLILFSKVLLTSMTLSFSYLDAFTTLMCASFLCEELKQAFGPGSSLKEYISDGWNQLDCLALGLYIIGLALKLHAHQSLLLSAAEANLAFENQTNITDTIAANSTWIASWGNFSVLDAYYEPVIQTTLDPYSIGLLDSNSLVANGDSPAPLTLDPNHNLTILDPDLPYYILTDDVFTISRIFFAFSLFAFYVRLMYIFSFSMVLGPKLIMINRMVVHDLLPFLLILLVCQIGYGIAFESISFANGYFADYDQSKTTINSTFDYKTGIQSFYDSMITSYFQMLGDFKMDELQGEDSSCRDNDKCPQTSARRLTTVMLSAFIVLTQVLMFNLLVATFTSTYNEIEGSAQYFWCYQRYEMIQEFVDRPSVAPPFMLIWYSVEFSGFILRTLVNALLGRSNSGPEDDDPFCRSLEAHAALDHKLTKWEHMMGTRRSKADTDGGASRKWTGRSRGDTHAIVLRAGAAGGAGAAGAVKGLGTGAVVGHVRQGEDPSSLLQGIGPIFGPETEFIEERFFELNNQLGRLSNFEERLGKVVQGANRLVQLITKVTDQQKQIMQSLHPPNGKRLVGRHRRDKSGKNQVLEAVISAVSGLDSHCKLIEDKIEEKIRIEEQCVKAVLTRSNGEQFEKDIPLIPPKPAQTKGLRTIPTIGSMLERLILSHRLWRIVPFNFENYPGIRMNVPPDKVNWKVPYEKYQTFTITDDRIALPYPALEDGPTVIPQNLQFNAYDSVSGVSRMAIRGRVRIMRSPDPALRQVDTNSNSFGLPLNPSGRSGLSGKGLLPHWGPNHAIVIGMSRAHPNHLTMCDLPVIQTVMLHRNQNLCLPWFLTDHREDCDFRECSANVIKAFLQRRIHNLFDDRELITRMLVSLKAATISLVYAGYLNDHLNADHAWIEVVFLNIHENPEVEFPLELIQVFKEQDSDEQILWLDVTRLLGMRSSHDELLIRLALHQNSYYSDALVEKQRAPKND